MRGIYSYNEVSVPPWATQALLKCEGNCLMSVVEAKFPTNSDSMSPKCWEALPHLNVTLSEIMKLIVYKYRSIYYSSKKSTVVYYTNRRKKINL